MLRGGDIAIASAWISDVDVEFPVNNRLDAEKLNLSEAIEEFSENEYRLISNDSDSNEYFLSQLPPGVEIEQLPELHAKTIVTDELAYVGSANITRNGISKNIEMARIEENRYRSTSEFLKQELDL